MSRTVKMVIGSILMMLGALYLIVMCVMGSERKEDARYFINSVLEVEYKDDQYLGSSAVTDWGEELEERDGYVYYCLDFEIENKSSGDYFGVPASAIRFQSDYSTLAFYEGRQLDYEKMFYGAAEPILPGKTKTAARIYLQVREGTRQVTASYRPDYDVEDAEIVILLEEPEL